MPNSYKKLASFGSIERPPFVERVAREGFFQMDTQHFHPYYEIYYLHAGQRLYFIEDRTYRIVPGDLVFIGKGVMHKTLDTGEPGHERTVIHVDDAVLDGMAGSDSVRELLLRPFRSQSPVLRLSGAGRQELDQLIGSLSRETEEQAEGCELLVRNRIADLLVLAARAASHEAARFEPLSPAHAKMTEVVRHINSSYAEPLSLSRLAERFYLSPWYLSRMFREATGFTLSEYTNLTRVREAQRLLRETPLGITEIAAAVGFDNFSHFGKTFKRIAGMSPRQYRAAGGSGNH
ncbi:AraC family transcriptional regulator [Paenibacillus thermoaerophilus]|uniref:AraC family transcriptional regulator n=1 Tax=Paenibacillus thermoaerophilus TaxID=1215385 RepID=A0ABW2V2I2_9BACL|nr:AraC family transcriptional regulator [Paenibacillus thermoaerophilus]TMV17441.1 helix-turn-helix domain-containing protein [Paenibacillus thermoaerophilus]